VRADLRLLHHLHRRQRRHHPRPRRAAVRGVARGPLSRTLLHPSITIVSSVSGREIDFTGPAYGGFKAALVHYAQGLAYRLAGKGIRANAVSPGNVYFEGGIWAWIEENNAELFKQAMDLNPSGRMATPEEIGRGIVFLASPASSFTSGTNLVIDGALTKGVQI
jgi:3-oxoacyl-[acyl-carrier protein] reductase